MIRLFGPPPVPRRIFLFEVCCRASCCAALWAMLRCVVHRLVMEAAAAS